jgi:GntR family transcriptional regulator/MocR family aminotransferase
VGIYGMSDYRADRSAEPPCLVLGVGNTSDAAMEAGLRAIADLIGGR